MPCFSLSLCRIYIGSLMSQQVNEYIIFAWKTVADSHHVSSRGKIRKSSSSDEFFQITKVVCTQSENYHSLTVTLY